MRCGLLVPTLMESEQCGMERLREAAALGDQYNFEALWVGDHLLYPTPILDSAVSVALLGSLTQRVNVGTNVLQLPLRRPIDVAKTYATISHLTGGRVILGVGVGGEYTPEWEAAGIDTRRRGRRCDEAIDALRWYWDGQRAQGEYATSPGVAVAPEPVGGHVPIWVGGRSGAAVRRAARCDGTLNMWVSPARCAAIRQEVIDARGGVEGFTFGLELLTRIEDSKDLARRSIHHSLRKLNLDPEALEKYTAFGTPEDVAECVQEYVAAGVQHVSFYLPGPGWSDQARALATKVMPLLEDLKTSASLDPSHEVRR